MKLETVKIVTLIAAISVGGAAFADSKPMQEMSHNNGAGTSSNFSDTNTAGKTETTIPGGFEHLNRTITEFGNEDSHQRKHENAAAKNESGAGNR